MRHLRIFVGVGLDEQMLAETLNQRQGSMLKDVAHALLVEHADDGATIQSVEVTHVSFESESTCLLNVEFETSWSIYKGCDDRNVAGREPQHETAEYTSDGYLVFTVPMPRRPFNPC